MRALTVDWNTTRLLAAAGLIAAALPAAVTTPAGPHLPGLQLPVALTAAGTDLSTAQAYLDAAGGFGPDNEPTASTELSDARGDVTAFLHGDPGATGVYDWGALTDWIAAGQLYPSAAQVAGDTLTASDEHGPVTTGTADTYPTDADPSHDTTLAQLISGIGSESKIETGNLGELEHLAQTAGGTDSALAGAQWVPQDLTGFQNGINSSLGSLSPADIAELQSNGLLSGFAQSDLNGILTSELNLNALSFEAAQQLGTPSVSGLAGVDASMITDAQTEYTDVSNLLGLLSIEQTFNDVSGWFSWL